MRDVLGPIFPPLVLSDGLENIPKQMFEQLLCHWRVLERFLRIFDFYGPLQITFRIETEALNKFGGSVPLFEKQKSPLSQSYAHLARKSYFKTIT